MNWLYILVLITVSLEWKVSAGLVTNKPCEFPFNYNGTSYNQCTREDSNKAWCSTDSEFNGDYKYCGDEDGSSDCVFPFTYKGKTYETCTMVNHHRAWCSKDAEYVGRWKNCENKGGDCVFPFIYKDQSYSQCILVDSNKPWCSADTEFIGNYKYCEKKTEGPCVFPFQYKDNSYNSCTMIDWTNPWCSLDADYIGNYRKCEVVNGGFSEWSEWSECSQECGEGIETRSRQCNNPSPQDGGDDCEGELTEEHACNEKACPINGGFSEWSEWSECSQECGGGIKTRSRQCNNPSPQNGGDDCEGELTDQQVCNEKACPSESLISEGKSASQSSNFIFGNDISAAYRAVDGVTRQNPLHFCSAIPPSTNPWWQVDLGSVYQINRLTIYNSKVDCCWERLGGFKVQVSSSSAGPFTECAAGPITTTSGQIINLNCVTVGRYVRITLPGSNKYLSLCEVQIYGVPK